MKNRHKYFRNERYKRKLERVYDETSNKWNANVMFIYSGEVIYHRPKSGQYTILKAHYVPAKRRRFFKKYCGKAVRKYKGTLKGNQYRKVSEYWWNID